MAVLYPTAFPESFHLCWRTADRRFSNTSRFAPALRVTHAELHILVTAFDHKSSMSVPLTLTTAIYATLFIIPYDRGDEARRSCQ